jgi:hypothetical protein
VRAPVPCSSLTILLSPHSAIARFLPAEARSASLSGSTAIDALPRSIIFGRDEDDEVDPSRVVVIDPPPSPPENRFSGHHVPL